MDEEQYNAWRENATLMLLNTKSYNILEIDYIIKWFDTISTRKEIDLLGEDDAYPLFDVVNNLNTYNLNCAELVAHSMYARLFMYAPYIKEEYLKENNMIKWDNIEDCYQFAAMDEDGNWYIYTKKPKLATFGWTQIDWCNSSTKLISSDYFENRVKDKIFWKDSLTYRSENRKLQEFNRENFINCMNSLPIDTEELAAINKLKSLGYIIHKD